MPKAIDPKATFDYVLECDRKLDDDDPYKTTWHLRGLTMSEETQLGDSLTEADLKTNKMSMATGTQTKKILRWGLQGWTNFNRVGENGQPEPVPFEPVNQSNPGVKESLLDFIESTHRHELANAIGDRGRVTVAEGN